ncbi:hypothetical protein Cgig2_028992 [Carnegiea gigantea]|uniref:Uncharacterized protein n=1 Tax=Carnegiea gigantea TaxID=171969 RepID=A0A9Q1JEG1_9CARY|nr:hypothetical protein Cgig2_028992 [Carnegiea gigantea]
MKVTEHNPEPIRGFEYEQHTNTPLHISRLEADAPKGHTIALQSGDARKIIEAKKPTIASLPHGMSQVPAHLRVGEPDERVLAFLSTPFSRAIMEALYPKKVKMLTINLLDRSTLVESLRMTQDFIQAMETCVGDAFVRHENQKREGDDKGSQLDKRPRKDQERVGCFHTSPRNILMEIKGNPILRDKKKHYEYHEDYWHITSECCQLKKALHELADQG